MSVPIKHPGDAVPVPTPLDDHGGGVRSWLGFALLGVLCCGLGYPLVTAMVGGWIFPGQAEGSLIVIDGEVRGSRLVGQTFADARYFQGRPSAAEFDPTEVGGSNFAPSNPQLRERIAADSQRIQARENVSAEAIPVDLVTASGSGIDPHLSPASAALQVPRIAAARGMDERDVLILVDRHTEGPSLGVFGLPRVNVLALNIALDRLSAADSRVAP